MIVGMITTGTCYGDAGIPVELLGKGPRPDTVWVKALGGLQPFIKISHGGPYQDDTLVIPLRLVRDVHPVRDPGESLNEESIQGPHTPAPDWFLESAYEDRTAGE